MRNASEKTGRDDVPAAVSLTALPLLKSLPLSNSQLYWKRPVDENRPVLTASSNQQRFSRQGELVDFNVPKQHVLAKSGDLKLNGIFFFFGIYLNRILILCWPKLCTYDLTVTKEKNV